MTKYNLLTEKWIYVTNTDGSCEHISIMNAFSNSHNIERINDAVPTFCYSTYKTLFAILMSSINIDECYDWADIWNQNQFTQEQIKNIEERCFGKFNLFDPEKPFYQNILDSKTEIKSINSLVEDVANKTSSTHKLKKSGSICPSCATKILLSTSHFSHEAGRGFGGGITNAVPIYAMPQGKNLFQTLLLNYILLTYRPDSGNNNICRWDLVNVESGKEINGNVDFLTGITWPSRTIQLLPEETDGQCSYCGQNSSVLINNIHCIPGWKIKSDATSWRDPWAAYEYNKEKSVYYPIKANESKDVWRDFNRIFLNKSIDGFQTLPLVLQQFSYLMMQNLIDTSNPYKFECFVFINDQARIVNWYSDSLQFNGLIMDNPSIKNLFDTIFDYSDKVHKLLYSELGVKINTKSNEKKKAKSVQIFASKMFWELTEQSFKSLLLDNAVNDESQHSDLIQEWKKSVRSKAIKSIECCLDLTQSSTKLIAKGQQIHVFKNKLAKC